jgi:hypothetical protein
MASSASITIDMRSPMERNGMPADTPISGAPYSGRQVFATAQIQPDGTRVAGANPTQVTVIARDSMGRVRTERPAVVTAQMPFFKMVTIEDPIGGYRYFLDPVNHVAHRMALPSDRKLPAPVSAQISAVRAVRPAEQGSGIVTATESLGANIVSGVNALGQRTTITYGPESETGKDHPAVSVQESWISPLLGIVVSSRTLTVAGLERTVTMADLRPIEPDPALFQVPPGYRVEEEVGDFTIVIPR